MHCHYCDREADVVVEREGVRVGLCEAHLRERLAELSDAEWLADVREQLES